MSESIKSYRIRTTVGEDNYVSVNLEQDYDAFDILSLTINTNDAYRLHNSNYGVVVGRVLANNGFGIPNAKISIFIEADDEQRQEMAAIYSYKSTADANGDGVRYNLLPDDYNGGGCYQVVGTFPNKRYVLDNEDVIEVFEKYFKYTTRTNNAGDYIIMGVPVGTQTLHMDLDLSDCGILSQRPRDFVYKGYTIEQFENPNMFKTGTSLSSLSQIFSQDQNVYVQPFWGNESLGDTIGITRADINVEFKFEPTCVFMGSVVSDNASNGISKNCKPTEHMGDMDELTTGEGTIEMIRKTFAGKVEEFRIKGNELINGAGIWCYQIPMNLDYMVTDEFGNMVPTDNPDKGIPTRARVRFRISMNDPEYNSDNFFRPKVLVPHNPQTIDSTQHENYDYNFGTATEEDSFRDLFWNNVYSVKSYIPRFQKKKVNAWKTTEFTGIKGCQAYGKNNPMPYNNIRIKLPFMFQVMCILIKIFIKMVGLLNFFIGKVGGGLADAGNTDLGSAIEWVVDKAGGDGEKVRYPFRKLYGTATGMTMTVIENGLCPDLENWYFAPIYGGKEPYSPPGSYPSEYGPRYNLMNQTLAKITRQDDPMSIDDQNDDSEDSGICLTIRTEYLIHCIEMNLAQEYRVINFDFYNDWINGTLYIPRFMRYIRRKKKFLGITVVRAKTKGCMDDSKIFSKSRRYTQICAVPYTSQNVNNNKYKMISKATLGANEPGSNRFHKGKGTKQVTIFGNKNGGVVHESETIKGQYVYYLKPCEWKSNTTKANLFATDIILLGSLNTCDINGIPQAFKHLTSSTYIMPTNLALTNMEEEGYIYARGDSGVMCSRNNSNSVNTDWKYLQKQLVPLSGGSLYDELRFYNGTSIQAETQYENDPSDTVPITEAAGISWNYIGPGQGENDKDKYYYPGGHFLGLSCVNSQTNIKSCINLERICEIGVNMSQRKEEVIAVDNGGLKYEYVTPSGLISGNDIVDEDFRTMFASLNKGRLIADKTNPETGYKTYGFSYVGPINFGGEMIEHITGTPYNTYIRTFDESPILNGRYNVASASSRDDYDDNEVNNTLRKTVEFPSADYYLFRFGLTYADIKNIADKHAGRFLKKENNGNFYYLPQYENSFYFYFGLQNGNTALDEFNKQFFSECPTKALIETTPEITVSDTNGFILCSGGTIAIVSVNRMTAPYSATITRSQGVPNPETIDNIENDTFAVFAPYGKTNIVVRDSDENEVNVEFFASENAVSWYINGYDFYEDVVTASTSRNNYEETGGYVEINNISIEGLNIDNSNVQIRFTDQRYGETYTLQYSDGRAIFKAHRPVVYEYDIIYSASCSELKQIVVKCGTITIGKPDDLYLAMGVGDVKTSTNNGAKVRMGTEMFSENWWQNKEHLDDDNDGRATEFWGLRKGLINGAATTAQTFSNLVSAISGSKGVWMTPQSSSGFPTTIAERQLCSNLYPDGIPAGFSVDDDASYYGTYRSGFNGIKPNYAVCYDEEGRIMGKHCGTVENEAGSAKTITITDANATLTIGAACAFKPLPDGPVIPCIFSGDSQNTVDKIICLWDHNEISQYKNGLVYQCVSYPIIKKPFSAVCNYFFSSTVVAPLDIIKEAENNVNHSSQHYWLSDVIYPEQSDRINAIGNGLNSATASVSAYNGTTFDMHFAGESYIKYAKDENGYRNKFEVQQADLTTELQNGPIHNRMTLFSGTTYSPSDNLVSLMIKEGYPHYKEGNKYFAYQSSTTVSEIDEWPTYSTFANEVELNDNTTFYNGFTIVDMISGSTTSNTVTITKIVANGSSDDDVAYYLFSGSLITKTDIISDRRENVRLFFPVYSDNKATAVTYSVRILSGQEETFLTAYLIPGGMGFLPCVNSAGTFSLVLYSGINETNLKNKILAVSGTTNYDGVIPYFLNTSATKINFIEQAVFNSISNEDALERCKNGQVEEVSFDEYGNCYLKKHFNDLEVLIMGVKKIENNGKAEGYISKIYHYIVKTEETTEE